MSGDLRAPSINIPNGTLSAISTGTFLYLVFVLFLGATCQRESLLTDFTIAAKVSAVSVLLLGGLYVSSMSSCLGAMYGTPRVLQSISLENVIPGIGILGTGVCTIQSGQLYSCYINSKCSNGHPLIHPILMSVLQNTIYAIFARNFRIFFCKILYSVI